MARLIAASEYTKLYQTPQNAVLVQYHRHDLPEVGGYMTVYGEIYRCGSSEKVQELLDKINAKNERGVHAVAFFENGNITDSTNDWRCAECDALAQEQDH